MMTTNGDITGPLGVPNGKVGIPDLLEMLSNWGDCPSDPSVPCWSDLDGSGAVGVSDLLALLASWGNCPGNCDPTSGLTLEQQLTEWGISQATWDDFLDVLAHEPKMEQDRWICWFERYMTQCTACRSCRGNDPFTD